MDDRVANIDYDDFMKLILTESKSLGPELQDITRAEVNASNSLSEPVAKLQQHPFTGIQEHDFPILCSLIDGTFQFVQSATGLERLVVRDTGDTDHISDDTSDLEEEMEGAESNTTRYKLRPNIAIYRPMPGVAEQPYEIPDDESSLLQVAAARRPWLGRSIWQSICVFVEVKTDKTSSRDEYEETLSEDSDSPVVTSRTLGCAAQIRLKQHRQFQYSVVTLRSTVWILRWDQVGALMATPFDYKEDPYRLIRFFYLIGQMNDSQLGIDPTLKPLEKDDKMLWDQCLEKVTDEDLRKRIMAVTDDDWPLQRIEVNGESLEAAEERWKSDGNTQRKPTVPSRPLLIGKPCAGHRSLTGRGTKGYIAFDLQDQNFVFLKDCWRFDHAKATPEMVTYARLHAQGVENIPEVVCGGDVYNPPGDLQRTLTHRYLNEKECCPYIHTRLVLKEIGRPLNEYTDSHELVQAVSGALKAHCQAWELAGILHRDISDGNIVIFTDSTNRVKGLLIDWELSKTKEQLDKRAVYPGRSGTWMFLSGLVVFYPGKWYELSDDLESFVHVLVIQLLRYHEHVYSDDPSSLYQHVMGKYINTSSASGYRAGQPTKMSDMKYGTITSIPLHEETISPAFLTLLTSLVHLCQQHYQLLDQTKMGKSFRKSPFTKVSTEELYQGKEQDSPLKNHDAMLAAFDAACRSSDWISDKIGDQFEGCSLKGTSFLSTPQVKWPSSSEF